MDIDISDILADLSRDSQSGSARLQSSLYASYDAQEAYADHVLLARAWTTERCTPTLQPYPARLIDRVMQRVHNQITRIEDMTSGVYDSMNSYTSDNNKSGPPTQNLNLTLSVLQTDLSRTQFLVRSLLRCRLSKLTKYATYYLKHHAQSADPSDSDAKAQVLLSPSETQFLQHHQALLSNLYNASFMSSLPLNLRRLDDRTGGIASMDEGPNEASGVFVRCLAEEWGNEDEVFRGDDGGDQSGSEDKDQATVEIRLTRGVILVARWRDVKKGVEDGELEVL